MAATVLRQQAMDSTTRLASKVITLTRDMTAESGAVSYTGVGFTPTSLMCLALVNGTFASSWSFADSARTIGGFGIGAADSTTYEGSFFVVLFGSDGGKYQTAALTSYNTDGFTLTWTKGGTPGAGTANIKVLCFR